MSLMSTKLVKQSQISLSKSVTKRWSYPCIASRVVSLAPNQKLKIVSSIGFYYLYFDLYVKKIYLYQQD